MYVYSFYSRKSFIVSKANHRFFLFFLIFIYKIVCLPTIQKVIITSSARIKWNENVVILWTGKDGHQCGKQERKLKTCIVQTAEIVCKYRNRFQRCRRVVFTWHGIFIVLNDNIGADCRRWRWYVRIASAKVLEKLKSKISALHVLELIWHAFA